MRVWRVVSGGMAAGLVMASATGASAQETTTYRYDALGRLIGSGVTGGPANGTNTDITYDRAGNRSNYKVTGAPATSAQSASAQVIVVPLNGFTVIPLRPAAF